MLFPLTIKKLLWISQNPPAKICIFGAGELGRTIAYDFITMAGLHIDFYCDNNVPIGTEIRDGIKVGSIDQIVDAHADIIIFIAASEIYQEEIYLQICNIDNSEILGIDNNFYCHAMSEIELLGGKVQKLFWDYYDDESYLRNYYKKRTGLTLDLKNPKSFNEKLQWLKLNDRKPLYTVLADKIEVKKYVSNKIGEGHTIPTIAVYDRVEDIDINLLPSKFVLKCSHDGGIIVCDKSNSSFDFDEVKNKLERRMRINYFWYSREWCYKNIVPRIICEPFVVDESGVELKDYKFFCFNGRPQLVQVDYNRFTEHKRNLYTLDWKQIDGEIMYPSDKDHVIRRPEKLEEMIKYASELSYGIPHVRTDFYLANDKILLGEMTFYHGSGCEEFRPDSLGLWLGNFIGL